jgi:3-hydroxyisobutyrate dehydrogenase/2-hydroxy-3-oxopropionate reductase
MRIGFVGLGVMGRPMARRLLDARWDVVAFDIAEVALAEVAAAGATPAGSAAEVAATADVVMTALPTRPAVAATYASMATVARPGQVFVDHSTVDLVTCRGAAEAVAAGGASYLDAPMSGGRERAADGTLTLFVGGDPLAFETALPVLRSYGSVIRLCGPTGAGTTMKAVNQLLVAIHTAATAEAAVLAAKCGIDPRVLLEMIAPSFGGSVIFGRHMPRIIARDFHTSGPLWMLDETLSLARGIADEVGAPLLLAPTVAGLLAESLERGMGDEDMAALVKLYEERAGVIVEVPPDARHHDAPLAPGPA